MTLTELMNDFKQRSDRFGGRRASGGFGKKFERPAYTGKPGYQRYGSDRPQGEMHQATCATCNKSCEVPFRPNGQRPVYCRDCFGASKGAAPASHDFQQRPTFRAPMPMPRSAPAQPQMPDPRIVDIQQNIAKMQQKLDQILVGMAVAKVQATIETSAPKAKKTAKKK